jgi:hypothetical protein
MTGSLSLGLLGGAVGGVGSLALGVVLGDGGVVVGLDLLLGLGAALLERLEVALALETLGGDETLDLGSLGVLLAGLGLDLTADNVGTDIVLLGEVEELADLGSALGGKALGRTTSVRPAISCSPCLTMTTERTWIWDGVRRVRHVEFVGWPKVTHVRGDDAAANRLPLALTSAAGTVARVAVGEEEAGTGGGRTPCFMGKPCLSLPPGTG